MVFSDITFLYIFLPATLILYFLTPKKLNNLFLLISGLFFYAWGEPLYVGVMVISTLVDYFAGLVLWKFDKRPAVRKAALIVSVVMNLGLLGLFKYSGFVVTNLNMLGANLPAPADFPIPVNILPIGISFFTFQSMSYTIDLYLRNVKVQKNPVTFAAYVTMFPQVVAGPIVRYNDVAAEMDKRELSSGMCYEGITRFMTGLGKKVLIANNIGLLWSGVKAMDYGTLPALTAWLGIIAYTLQIYFDFSGYSDMAVGLGKIFGFNFPENFRYPYMSRSISEFWRRWHMTLGAWFKSYVYFPLGGSRKGLRRTCLNLAVVWILTGIWHGASWNFILWGSLYGAVIILEKLFLGKLLLKTPAAVQHVYTMLLVILGWVIFDTASLADSFRYMGAMFGGSGIAADDGSFNLIINYAVMLVIGIFGCTDLFARVKNRFALSCVRFSHVAEPVCSAGILLLSTAYLVNANYNPFLYFNF
ncbi:alginate regulatory protein [Clostridia bacterium]|nr:alginate regulatory protein [Clostridia bacterium]